MLICLISEEGLAQIPSVNFSQYFNFPALYQPNSPGSTSDKYEIRGIYRQQWQTIDAQFQTFGISGSYKINKNPLGKGAIGLGFYALDDKLGNNVISFQEVGINAALHYPLDFEERHLISFGINSNFSTSAVNYEDLYFQNQYNGFFLDRNLPTGESIANENVRNINFGAALGYKMIINPGLRANFNLSALDILKPKESFLTESMTANKSMQWFGDLSIKKKLNTRLAQSGLVQVMSIQNAQTYRIGSITEYSALNNGELKLSAGLFYELEDALIAYGGLGYKQYAVHLSYDFTMSNLNDITSATNQSYQTPGAFEISFVMKGLAAGSKTKYAVPCRFF
ncbi:type IX secretion system membrane protein PorP/SprF [Fulvivirga sp. RKSG066]|nr:type IX secretion system membrane protein PorP/SprF [Fulvivirga aurantia]